MLTLAVLWIGLLIPGPSWLPVREVAAGCFQHSVAAPTG